jgi:hypothetical protein
MAICTSGPLSREPANQKAITLEGDVPGKASKVLACAAGVSAGMGIKPAPWLTKLGKGAWIDEAPSCVVEVACAGQAPSGGGKSGARRQLPNTSNTRSASSAPKPRCQTISCRV